MFSCPTQPCVFSCGTQEMLGKRLNWSMSVLESSSSNDSQCVLVWKKEKTETGCSLGLLHPSSVFPVSSPFDDSHPLFMTSTGNESTWPLTDWHPEHRQRPWKEFSVFPCPVTTSQSKAQVACLPQTPSPETFLSDTKQQQGSPTNEQADYLLFFLYAAL